MDADAIWTDHRSPPLSGLTNATICRVRFADGSVITKQTTNADEAFFYEQVAPTLRGQGVPSPKLLFLAREAESAWLVMEDIPQPFPQERWLADEEQVALLRRLHGLDGVEWRTAPTLYRPKWTEEMTQAALTWFPASVGHELQSTLAERRLEAQPLFEPSGLISGDPNPRNWGMRHDDTLVHFDWERFGWGTPAIDLAITVPGFGTMEDYQLVAAKYLHSAKNAKIENLAEELQLAKAWTIVELLSNFRSHGPVDEDILSYLI